MADADLSEEAAAGSGRRAEFLTRWESRTVPLIILAAVLPLVG